MKSFSRVALITLSVLALLVLAAHLLLLLVPSQPTLHLHVVKERKQTIATSSMPTSAPIPSADATQQSNFVIMLPWTKRTYVDKMTIVPSTSCPHRCDYVTRSHSRVANNPRSVDVLLFDSIGKKKEDISFFDFKSKGRGSTERPFLVGLWNTENWRGRANEWGSKYRVRWLNETTVINGRGDVSSGYGENTDFWNSFDLSLSFETTAIVSILYAHFWRRINERAAPFFFAKNKNKKKERNGDASLPLAVYIASNCHTRYEGYRVPEIEDRFPGKFKHRDDVVKRLMKGGVSVAAYGQCLKNRDKIEEHGCGSADGTKYCVISKHLFYLAFENSIYPDYVTEKVYEPLAAGAIPVYLGAPNVDEFLPTTHSIINFHDFASVEELASYLLCVAKNQSVREHYLSWRERKLFATWKRISAVEDDSQLPLCKLCGRLHTTQSFTSRIPERKRGKDGKFDYANKGTQKPLPCSIS